MKKKFGWLAAMTLMAATVLAAQPLVLYGTPVSPVANEVTRLLTGETLIITTEPGHPAKAPTCRVLGESVSLTDGSGSGSAEEGYRFVLKAEQAGAATLEIQSGKKTTKYPLQVIDPKDVPLVTAADLHGAPGSYAGRLVKLSGVNRGWGAPEQAKEIWGEMVTRSDWILEDDTGAVYLTGFPHGENNEVTVIASVSVQGKKWSLLARRVMPREAPEPEWNGKADVTLSPDQENVLQVGQVGLVDIHPDRSTIFDFEIVGDAVKAVKSDRDVLYVRAEREGTAEVRIYLRHFLDLGLTDNEGPPQPSQVFKIKVEGKK